LLRERIGEQVGCGDGQHVHAEMRGKGLQSLALTGAVDIGCCEPHLAAFKARLGGELGGDGGFARAMGSQQQKRGRYPRVHRLNSHALIESCGQREAEVGQRDAFGFSSERFGKRAGQSVCAEQLKQRCTLEGTDLAAATPCLIRSLPIRFSR
jgi:hypothetical protein